MGGGGGSSRGGANNEGNGGAGAGPAEARPVPGSRDFATKILHMAWHPKEHVLACAASNSLYVFNA